MMPSFFGPTVRAMRDATNRMLIVIWLRIGVAL
jgi:hypothetical protein